VTLTVVLSALIEVLSAAPKLVSAVEDVIAAFKSGGKPAAQTMLASKIAADTAALEQELQTPIS
jgi:hypothetical protein